MPVPGESSGGVEAFLAPAFRPGLDFVARFRFGFGASTELLLPLSQSARSV